MKSLLYRIKNKREFWLFVFVFLFFFVLNVIRLAYRPLDHDENLYISAAWLVSKGYLPYKDFNFGHPPLQPLLMFPIVKFIPYKLFAFRFINSFLACITIIISSFYLYKSGKLIGLDVRVSFVLSLVFAVLFFFNTNFLYTSGVAWHHDLYLFLFGLALFSFFKKKFFLSGFFFGLMFSTRLTASVICLGFLFWVFLQKRQKLLISFCGFLLGALPLIVFFVLSPVNFIAFNIKRAEAIEIYMRFVGKWYKVVSFSGKMHRFKKVFAEPSLLPVLIALFVLFLLLLVKDKRKLLEIRFLFWISPFVMISVFLPPALWLQYFYPLVFLVFLVFGMLLMNVASFFPFRYVFLLCLSLLIISIFSNYNFYYQNIKLFLSKPFDSLYTSVHSIGEEIAQLTPPGKILTLCPLFPIEGDKNIYLYLADGPFSWRNSLVLKKPENFGLISPQEFFSSLEKDKPAGIFLGCEPSFLERPFMLWALKNNYVCRKVDDFKLYVPSNKIIKR